MAAQVTWVDAHGHPAVVDGATVWTSGDPTIVQVTVDAADSTKATVAVVGGMLGTVQVSASADADIGSGTQTIVATGNVTVVAGTAVAGTIQFTPPA